MDSKYLDLFKDIWNAPAGKQVIALLMIIPVGMGFFYHFYFEDILDSRTLEIKELKLELKTEDEKYEKLLELYISANQKCNDRILKVDSIHIAKFNEYRDRVESKNNEISDKWEQAYKDNMKTLIKTRRLTEKTIQETSN